MRPENPAGAPISIPLRIGAALAGAIVLVLSALFSVGASLFAPLGVLAAGAVAQGRGGRATRATTWVGAIIASIVALVAGAALIFLILPPDTLDQIQAGIDSAQTETRSQQLEELGRRGVDPAVAERITNPSPSINIWVGIFGGMIAVGFLGTMAGSAGWAATFLIAGALGGRWPWRGDPASIVPGERA